MDNFESARNIAHIFLGNNKYKNTKITPEIISEEVENVFLMPGFSEVNKEDLIIQLQADFDVYSGEATMLVERDIKPWLFDAKAGIKWQLWNRYKSYLKMNDGSFPVDSLDDLTDKILDKCVNPKINGSWDRRGMVVGNVQSGKTANYTGIINKATDAGYKLIIVMAGMYNSLRSQTQLRVDKGYIGRKSSDFLLRHLNVKVGVGDYAVDTEIYSYTSSDNKGDFNRSIASKINVPIGGKSPTVLVIKKNKSILENLILWLNQFAVDVDGQRKLMNIPLLIIDDEADNASVNSGTQFDVKTINRLIRTLLNLFNQNTFIGYTATPYANLYIPSSWSEELETFVKDVKLKVGEDLFPRDFIINIPPPSNYIGAAQVFGFENQNTGESTDGLDIIRFVEDQEPLFPRRINSENAHELPEDVPSSLKTAIKSFILTNAIRRLRGHGNKHSSMLVHVALRVLWIDRIAWLVNEILRGYINQINSGQGNLLSELEEMFYDDFLPTTKEVKENIEYNDPKIIIHTWEEVKAVLKAAVTKIEVRSVHGLKRTNSLEYHRIEEIDYDAHKAVGLSVIAVGGNKLARGITLEGLSVSYYLRTTRMYDSLMQMGRWFGYRPGYVDLCRLYTTADLVDWYRHVTMATEEMRHDFDEMAANNRRPADYQLKVRTHPGMLMVTSLTKMKDHEKIQVGYSGKVIQTYSFNKKDVKGNYSVYNYFLSRLDSNPIEKLTSSGKTNSLLWIDINSEKIIDFLSTVRVEKHRLDVVTAYINKQNQDGLLTEWSVAIWINSQNENKSLIKWQNGEFKGGLATRTFTGDDTNLLQVPNGKNAILAKEHRTVDLTFDSNSKLTENEIKLNRKRTGKPLLVLMPIDSSEYRNIEDNTPIIGIGIIFPIIDKEQKFEYAARPINSDFEDILQESDDNDEVDS
ncbi:MAG: endonuclease [Bacteroidetes bacterium]|nr:MAG: endonuclease [Bacteroidota bacterium]MBL1145500.1 endonuclease [Bacteroidota bacterium]NOG58298.1 Z1 domain-containing protein [Bacteroidota bacterium]